MRPRALGLVTFSLVCLLTPSMARARDLSFEDRVAAQRAIEEVYWRHRIWPRENVTAKLALSDVMTETALRAKVEDYLKKSRALERHWQKPITGTQLQAESDRMASRSQALDILREIFDALGNDPFLIAETLARQTLADRLIRNWYAYDKRFHEDIRREAEEAVAGTTVAAMKVMARSYHEATWAVAKESDPLSDVSGPHVIRLGAAEWRERIGQIAVRFGTIPEGLPLLEPGGLQEGEDSFFVTAVLSRNEDSFTTATASWPKKPFDSWWAVERTSMPIDLPAAPGPFSLPVPRVGGCIDDSWRATPTETPDPRFEATAVWTGSEMIVWGGANSVSVLAAGGRYNPATDSWLPIATGPTAPSPRLWHTAVWTGSNMIVWGGTGQSSILNTGGRYDPLTDSWLPTSTSANVPSPRSSHTAVWTGSEMVVWGGSEGPNVTNTGGRYDPSTGSWLPTSLGANVPSARYIHTAVWTGSDMIVWGGYTGSSALHSGGRYRAATNSWLPTSTGVNVPSARLGHRAVWTGGEMILWGGNNGSSVLNTGGRYHAATDSWLPTSMGPGVPSARGSHTTVWTGSEMIVWGGTGAGFTQVNTGGRYDPGTDSWLPTATGTNVPAARHRHAAVWTGNEMIVWGGEAGATRLDTGGRYDPGTDSWIPTATGGNVPAARLRHVAVWTGSEMIIWGGTGDSSDVNTGGRYDPATDTWSPTSVGANVPSPRSSHTVVWTGSEVIVWGGGFVNTGGRYNPSTDSWLPTSTGDDVPSARAGHTAVWTGNNMIVWGGRSGGSRVNTGGRYDPLTDSWLPTSTGDNVPSGRSSHTAVWSGDEMIVWGGTAPTGNSSVNTGARYSPTADSWLPTSTGANVPSPRGVHTAVWTGSEMIVWGGNEFSTSFLATGGRYDPPADAWVPTSVIDVASARYWHTAIWTGGEMIVWGGVSGGTVNTGSRYNPATDSWFSTSMVANLPSPREEHSAVWTGTQMIVWGGSFTSSGGLYCATPCTSPPPSTLPTLTEGKSAQAVQLTWPAVAGATRYDVVKGFLPSLQVTAGDFARATWECLANNFEGTEIQDPSSSDGFWYLVRAVNCGGNGSYDSGGTGQQEPRDAEIAASGVACP